MPRALISVSDKRGVVEFAEGLTSLGWDIVSTGGTAAALRKAGISVTAVDAITGFPEILDGRVKTLHPAIHAGLLARQDVPTHVQAMEEHGLSFFDLVAVNLYPFQATIANPEVDFADAIENIDIGGPAMLRAAAKNHASVIPVVSPMDYHPVLAMIGGDGVTPEARQELAAKVFTHVADYDAAVARYLTAKSDGLPARINLSIERKQSLRYGENPVQRAALYVTEEPRGFGDLRQLSGKELSFNNLLDIDAAVQALTAWSQEPACVFIKHTTPCGIALGRTAVEAVERARSTDPVSAFGSVIGVNTVVDRAVAESLSDLFVEVIVAPAINDDALEIFRQKKNLRAVELPIAAMQGSLDWKRVRGGFLIQDRFVFNPNEESWKVVTKRAPSPAEWDDLRFGWAASAAVKSNAILLARELRAIGIGAGQMSRVDAVFLAVHKARQQNHALEGATLASDAFFPFPDGVELAAGAGISSIIQPGGSIRDDEVIAAADRLGLTMVLTGVRQFRH